MLTKVAHMVEILEERRSRPETRSRRLGDTWRYEPIKSDTMKLHDFSPARARPRRASASGAASARARARRPGAG